MTKNLSPNPQPDQKSGSPQQVSEVFGLNQGTLANRRCQRRPPRYYRCGKKIIYFFADVEKWIKENPVITTDSEEVRHDK